MFIPIKIKTNEKQKLYYNDLTFSPFVDATDGPITAAKGD